MAVNDLIQEYQSTFEKYLDYLSELPKSEQKRVEKITF